jgi:hypothetical protein
LGARFDEDGFLRDTPVVTRAGIFTYLNFDGSERREFRPPEEVLRADSLTSYKGKPILFKHPPGVLISGRTIKGGIIGSVLSEGRADGDNVTAEVVIHDRTAIDSGYRELSLGYIADLDPTPGEYKGARYDAVQRNIAINHLALVPKGRAGNARLRLDAEDNQVNDGEDKYVEKNLQVLRLDSGLTYEVPPEVAVAFRELKTRADGADSAKSSLQAERDKLEGERDALKGALEKARTDAETEKKARADAFDQQVKEHVELLKIADIAGVKKTDGLSGRELKKAVIRAVHGDSVKLDGKSDDYIEARFDAAADSLEDKGIEEQRKASARTDEKEKTEFVSLEKARNDMIERLENAWNKEEKK